MKTKSKLTLNTTRFAFTVLFALGVIGILLFGLALARFRSAVGETA